MYGQLPLSFFDIDLLMDRLLGTNRFFDVNDMKKPEGYEKEQ